MKCVAYFQKSYKNLFSISFLSIRLMFKKIIIKIKKKLTRGVSSVWEAKLLLTFRTGCGS